MEELVSLKRLPINKEAAPGIAQTRGDNNCRLKSGADASHPAPTKCLELEGKGKSK
jgi:hypothetical protein